MKKKKNFDKNQKERIARVKKQKEEKNKKDKFDLENEILIQMTNRNKIRQEEKQKVMQKVKKKRNIKKTIIISIISIICIITGGIIFALISPIFNIKDIQVYNNSQINGDTVKSLSQLEINKNIFHFNEKTICNNIKENPYIENVKIRRELPSTVIIEVKEREPQFSIDFMGKYVYINNQGYLLEISEDSKQLPIILGVDTPEEEIELGKRLNKVDLEKLGDILKIINASKEQELDKKITKIDITNKNEYILYLENEQKKIHIGDTNNLSNKVLFILAILEQQEGVAGDIYVNRIINNKLQPYFEINV